MSAIKFGTVSFNHMTHNGTEVWGFECPTTHAAYRIIREAGGAGYRVDSLRHLNPAWEAVSETAFATRTDAARAAVTAAKAHKAETLAWRARRAS